MNFNETVSLDGVKQVSAVMSCLDSYSDSRSGEVFPNYELSSLQKTNREDACLSIIRQLLVLCPAAFILSRFFGINGVWASFALAECFGLTFSVIFFIHVYKTRIRNLERR